MCLAIRPGLVISCALLQLLRDALLFTRSGRAAYLRTCAILKYEPDVVVFGVENPPADVVQMASTAIESSVDQFSGSVGCELVKTWCFNTASLHYNHVMTCID